MVYGLAQFLSKLRIKWKKHWIYKHYCCIPGVIFCASRILINIFYITTIEKERGNSFRNSRGAVFTVCLRTFTLFWLRKTSVTFEMLQWSVPVFMSAFIRRTLHFSIKFPVFFLHFCVIRTSALSLSTRSLFYVNMTSLVVYW